MEMAQSTSVMRDIYSQRVTIQKQAISNLKVDSKLDEKSLIGTEKEKPMKISALLTSHSVNIEKPLSIMESI